MIDLRQHRRPRRLPLLPLARAAILLVIVALVGTVGLRLVTGTDHSWFDALYLTVVTLTTVGYGETIDLQAYPGGRAFALALMVTGVGATFYFFSSLIAFTVEGRLDELWRRRRMTRDIARMHAHTIVCGVGETGRHIVAELARTGRDVVVVECDADLADTVGALCGVPVPVVLGDATDDEVLRAAGIERASGLIACVSNDKDNLLITFSARQLQPALRIVSRCIEDRIESKLRAAGADAVVSPNAIGGLRMASELVRPAAVSFLDRMLRHDDAPSLRVESVAVAAGSGLDGVALHQLPALGVPDALIMARRHPDGRWQYNPHGPDVFAAGDELVFVADADQRRAMERLAGAGGGV